MSLTTHALVLAAVALIAEVAHELPWDALCSVALDAFTRLPGLHMLDVCGRKRGGVGDHDLGDRFDGNTETFVIELLVYTRLKGL